MAKIDLAMKLDRIILDAVEARNSRGIPCALYFSAKARKSGGDLRRLLEAFAKAGPMADKAASAYVEEAIRAEIKGGAA